MLKNAVIRAKAGIQIDSGLLTQDQNGFPLSRE